MNLINNAQTAIEKAIRHFRCMADDARIVLDSGFGTHPGERDLLYRNQLPPWRNSSAADGFRWKRGCRKK